MASIMSPHSEGQSERELLRKREGERALFFPWLQESYCHSPHGSFQSSAPTYRLSNQGWRGQTDTVKCPGDGGFWGKKVRGVGGALSVSRGQNYSRSASLPLLPFLSLSLPSTRLIYFSFLSLLRVLLGFDAGFLISKGTCQLSILFETTCTHTHTTLSR